MNLVLSFMLGSISSTWTSGLVFLFYFNYYVAFCLKDISRVKRGKFMDRENAHPPSFRADADASSIPIGGTQGTRCKCYLFLHLALVFWSRVKYLWLMLLWLILSNICTFSFVFNLF